jgi:hypothetical protein
MQIENDSGCRISCALPSFDSGSAGAVAAAFPQEFSQVLLRIEHLQLDLQISFVLIDCVPAMIVTRCARPYLRRSSRGRLCILCAGPSLSPTGIPGRMLQRVTMQQMKKKLFILKIPNVKN